MDTPIPMLEEFRRLYEAAQAFKEQAPWEWMFEDEIFGVRNPETGYIGYASVMGRLGEHLALGVYLGSEGLIGFYQLSAGEEQDNADLFARDSPSRSIVRRPRGTFRQGSAGNQVAWPAIPRPTGMAAVSQLRAGLPSLVPYTG